MGSKTSDSRSEEHTSELQSPYDIVCRLLLEKKKIALFEGAAGLRSRGLRLLAPMKPMLAEIAEDLDEVLQEHGGQAAIEYKLDGARIQTHRKGNVIRISSRRLSDVTDSLPEIVAIAKSLFFSEFLLHRELDSFPTRRSSD